jgi:hypothetical protein
MSIKLTDGDGSKFQPLSKTAFGSLHQQVVMPLFTARPFPRDGTGKFEGTFCAAQKCADR